MSIGFRLGPATVAAFEDRIAGEVLLDQPGGVVPLARVRRGKRGLVVLTPLAAGGRWLGGFTLGVFAGASLAFIEGRAAAIASGDAEEHALAGPGLIGDVSRVGRRHFEGLGLDLGDAVGVVRRADLASEVEFVEQGDGLAFLDALSHLGVPRYKTDAWRHNGRVETVYLRTPRRGHAKARAYDKRVEQGHAGEAGKVVRLERQERWSASRAYSVPSFLMSDLAALFARPFAPLVREGEGLTIAGIEAASELLIEMASAGRLSHLRAERLIGTLTIAARLGADATWWSSRTAARRRAELREVGICLDTHRAKPSVVPVGDLLSEMVDAWRVHQLAVSA